MTKARDNANGGASEFSELTDTTVSTSDPLGNSNPSSGVGHIWANKTSGNVYVLTNATAGSNVWTNVGDGSGTKPGQMEATGGAVTTVGDFKVHTFNSSGTFTVLNVGAIGTVEVLLIAGGGGTGATSKGDGGAGGGGAGGLLYYGAETPKTPNGASVSVSETSYSIVIGAGGGSSSALGAPGANSTGFSLTSSGGGRGGSYPGTHNNAYSSLSGGSGGGVYTGTTGSVSGQGNDGGASGGGANYQGGGGGGAGAVGQVGGSGSNGGAGGAGLAYVISGSSVTRAGGGGGYGRNNSAGAGGAGGGGGAVNYGTGTAGGANTGGGAGAGNSTGGSGVCIIRYRFQAA